MLILACIAKHFSHVPLWSSDLANQIFLKLACFFDEKDGKRIIFQQVVSAFLARFAAWRKRIGLGGANVSSNV
jgi:hypothetical protein